MSYINEILDDAKMTATKEAKRIVLMAIQRVAAETAIENDCYGVPYRLGRDQGTHHRP